MAGQTEKGKAFEYACLVEIERIIVENNKKVTIFKDDEYNKTSEYFNNLKESEKEKYKKAAKTAIGLITPLEPKLKNGNGVLILSLNKDEEGKKGDVRDIVCKRKDDNWEIGFSCKHNHEALKHSRLTKDPDFGKNWIGKPCSKIFIKEIEKIFEPLKEMPEGTLWKEVKDKKNNFYIPILEAFKNELIRLCDDAKSCEKLMCYILGNKDFYKIIAEDRNEIVKIEAFNIFNTLGKECNQLKPSYKIKKIKLPTEIVFVRRINETTLEVYMDNGWNFSMRLHNKDKKASITSLAWDINLISIPTDVFFTISKW